MTDTTSILLTLSVSVLVAIIGAIPGLISLVKIRELHVIVNSRLSELLVSVRAEGVHEGEKKAQK